MKNNPRLQPWLELADELDEFASFMHAADLAPRRATRDGPGEFLDVGAETANRMRAIAKKRWTWFSCQRDRMQGEVRAKLHTFHRWVSEGFFYGSEGTEAWREMMDRIDRIERRLDALSAA
ncbi:hypothetical protein [Novilysobacter erysipheiresistens]|uniref:Four helix bundle protein n=1 Tax=Novilysobacter erysipheiresistens TaxID=1749332 RepID=A0ABU7Z1W6_9GAMM